MCKLLFPYLISFALLAISNSFCFADDTDSQMLYRLPKPFSAADFNLIGEDGKRYQLSQYRGQTVILNFWATWCPPCREEFPSMEKAWQKIKGKGIVLLGLNVGETEDDLFTFLADYPVTFPLPLDSKGEIVKQYPVIGLPTTYIINPKGFATHRVIGTRDWSDPIFLNKIKTLYE